MTDKQPAYTLKPTIQPKSSKRVIEKSSPPNQSSPDLLVELLDTIEAKTTELYMPLMLGAIPFEFDESLFSSLRIAMSGMADSDAEHIPDAQILVRLELLSFVYATEPLNVFTPRTTAPQEPAQPPLNRKRYSYSPEARQLLLQRWQRTPDAFVEANRHVLAYYEEKLAGLPHAFTRRSASNTERATSDKLTLAVLYHTLAVDPERGVALLQKLFQAARLERRLAMAERYIDIADEQRDFLSIQQQHTLDFMEGQLQYLFARQAESRARYESLLAKEQETPGSLGRDLQSQIEHELARV